MGCNGGLMDNAFKYVEANGLTTEQNYPYQAVQGECKSSQFKSEVYNKGYSDVTEGDSYLETAITQGPVSIAIEADQSAFQFYSSGVLDSGCGDALDHGVLVVGYDAEAADPYWIVKNSWGPTWGDQGFIKITQKSANNGEGECGILASASFPTF